MGCDLGLWKYLGGAGRAGAAVARLRTAGGGGGDPGCGGGGGDQFSAEGRGMLRLRRTAPGTTAGVGGGAGGAAALPSSEAGILESALAGGGARH